MVQERVGVEERAGVRVFTDVWGLCDEVSRLRGAGVDVGYDIETTSTDPFKSKIITLQFKPKGKKTAVFDVRNWSKEELEYLGTVLEPLYDGTVTLVGHNLKFDLEFALAQLKVAGHKAYDTMLAEQVILGLGESSANRKGVHFGMKDLAERYELPVTKEERSWFIGLDERPEWNDPLPDEQLSYIRQDVSVVHVIKEKQAPLIKEFGLEEVIELEMGALFSVVLVEYWGVQIDKQGWFSVIDRVKTLAQDLERILHVGKEGPGGFDGLDVHVLNVRHQKYMLKWEPYEKWMKERDAFIETQRRVWQQVPKGQELVTTNGTFTSWAEYKKSSLEWYYKVHGKLTKPPEDKSPVNLGSWMQVRDGFNDLGIPIKGSSEEALKPYLGQHPLVQVAIDYSHALQLIKMYGNEKASKREKSFADMLDEYNRLRASYKQIGADTGRMSSYKPNFQQVPSNGLGAELRKYVVAEEGYTLLDCDFPNIELRIVAELSGDKFLLDAFASGMDLHAYTAIVMFGLTIPEGENPKKWTDSHDAVIGGKTLVNTTYRTIAKTINFMLLYGAGIKKLAAKMGVSEQDAKSLLKLYRETFASAVKWIDAQKKRLDEAMAAGEQRVFACTRSGRRRYFDIPHPPRYPARRGEPLTVEAAQKYEEDMDEYRKQLGSIRRQLGNTPVQGLSADITKYAALLWYQWVGFNPAVRLVAIIHDEFLVECLPECAEWAAKMLERCMYTAMERYLKVVDHGKVKAVVTPFWVH